MDKTILIGIPCLMIGGTEIQTLRLVQALVAGNYRCVTVCYFEFDAAMVKQFEDAGSEVVCLSPDGTRPETVLGSFRFLQSALKNVVATYKPDVAHIQYMAPGALPILILRHYGVKTIVATLHTDASIYKNSFLVRFLQRHSIRLFTCVTEIAERSFFGESHLFNDKTTLLRHNHITIHNCLAPNHLFNNHPVETSETASTVTIGIVARLELIKGVDLVMPAFAEVKKRFPNCRLLIVGDGKLRTQMEHRQHEMGIGDDSVSWTGRVEYSRLPSLYQKMDIVWVPSRSEGFGLSTIEAMSQGCAVVVSDAGGLPEIVHDRQNGLVFQTEDVSDLAAKTVQLIEDRKLLSNIRDEALHTSHQFCFENYKDSILTLYHKIIS